MADVTNFWDLPSTEQQFVKNEAEQEAKAQQLGQRPMQVTLANAFEAEVELATCSTSLFIVTVQDLSELGGGYRLYIIALDTLVCKHFFNELDQVEDYLADVIPYVKHSPVWVPLPGYHIPGKSGTDYLKRLLDQEKSNNNG